MKYSFWCAYDGRPTDKTTGTRELLAQMAAGEWDRNLGVRFCSIRCCLRWSIREFRSQVRFHRPAIFGGAR